MRNPKVVIVGGLNRQQATIADSIDECNNGLNGMIETVRDGLLAAA